MTFMRPVLVPTDLPLLSLALLSFQKPAGSECVSRSSVVPSRLICRPPRNLSAGMKGLDFPKNMYSRPSLLLEWPSFLSNPAFWGWYTTFQARNSHFQKLTYAASVILCPKHPFEQWALPRALIQISEQFSYTGSPEPTLICTLSFFTPSISSALW